MAIGKLIALTQIQLSTQSVNMKVILGTQICAQVRKYLLNRHKTYLGISRKSRVTKKPN